RLLFGRGSMIDARSRPRRRERVLTQTAAGTLVLLDLDGGQYYSLDEVSARVWELCDGEHGVEGIVEAVSAEYDAPVETIYEDVLAFLEEMMDEKLLVVEGA
ncbi:MAG TPA: PqqD family protein, partial [Gemmatimonadales bacterium]|nr:PqqD family protein [Gemmatimonadales bacterium]